MRIDWEALPAAPGMRAGATRRAIAADLLSIVQVQTAPDADFADDQLHRHDNEQLLIMIRGQLTVRIDDAEVKVGAGDAVFFPRGSWHAAVGVGAEGAEYYEIFAPARVDQLPGFVGTSPLERA